MWKECSLLMGLFARETAQTENQLLFRGRVARGTVPSESHFCFQGSIDSFSSVFPHTASFSGSTVSRFSEQATCCLLSEVCSTCCFLRCGAVALVLR